MNVVKAPLPGDGGTMRQRAPERNVTERSVGQCRAQPARCERSRISRASGAGAGAGTDGDGNADRDGDGELEKICCCIGVEGNASVQESEPTGEAEGRNGDTVIEGGDGNATAIGGGGSSSSGECGGGGGAQR
jgi:hypothetical protein